MSLIEKIALKPCPFCNAELDAPSPVQHPKTGLARIHPGSIDDGSCPIAGWGFYDEQLVNWNNRAALTAIMGEGDGVTEWDREAARLWLGAMLPKGQSMPDALANHFARHRQLSAAAERARIVAWLRDGGMFAATDTEIADAIERGEI